MEKTISRTVIGTIAAVMLVAVYSTVVNASTFNSRGDRDEQEKSTTWSKILESTELGNKATLKLMNMNMQTSESGEAEVEENVTVGNVATGASRNSNATAVTMAVDNTSSNKAALQSSGSSATMQVAATDERRSADQTSSFSWTAESTTLTNEAYASIFNTNMQKAESGEAEVEENVTVGNVTTGDATNTNTTSVIFTVAN